MDEKLETIKVVEYANGLAMYALSELEHDLNVIRAATNVEFERNEQSIEKVNKAIYKVLRCFFGSAKTEAFDMARVPDSFWLEPAGRVVARGQLWVKAGGLISLLEGARILFADDIAGGYNNDQTAMVRLGRLIKLGRINRYIDYTENNPQHRGRVDRREILEYMKQTPRNKLSDEEKKIAKRERLKALHSEPT